MFSIHFSNLNLQLPINEAKRSIRSFFEKDKRVYLFALAFFSVVLSVISIYRWRTQKKTVLKRVESKTEQIFADLIKAKPAVKKGEATDKTLVVPKYGKLLERIKSNTKDLEFTYLSHNTKNCISEKTLCPKAGAVDVGNTKEIYLHATHININNQRYIAAQYPLQPELFWKAAKEYTNVIVDLMSKEEIEERSLEAYAPLQIGQTIKYGSVQVTLQKEINLPKLDKATLCHYQVTDSKGTREVFRIQANRWNRENGVDMVQLGELVNYIQPADREQRAVNCPIIFGARESVSAAVIIALNIQKQIDQNKIENADSLEKEIEKIATALATQRGPKSVCSKEDLQAIWMYANNEFYQ